LASLLEVVHKNQYDAYWYGEPGSPGKPKTGGLFTPIRQLDDERNRIAHWHPVQKIDSGKSSFELMPPNFWHRAPAAASITVDTLAEFKKRQILCTAQLTCSIYLRRPSFLCPTMREMHGGIYLRGQQSIAFEYSSAGRGCTRLLGLCSKQASRRRKWSLQALRIFPQNLRTPIGASKPSNFSPYPPSEQRRNSRSVLRDLTNNAEQTNKSTALCDLILDAARDLIKLTVQIRAASQGECSAEAGLTTTRHPLHGPELRALRPNSPYVFTTEAGSPVTTSWFLRMEQAKPPSPSSPFTRTCCAMRAAPSLANGGHDTRSLAHYLGHRNGKFRIGATG
jgi:hypothetical protein